MSAIPPSGVQVGQPSAANAGQQVGGAKHKHHKHHHKAGAQQAQQIVPTTGQPVNNTPQTQAATAITAAQPVQSVTQPAGLNLTA